MSGNKHDFFRGADETAVDDLNVRPLFVHSVSEAPSASVSFLEADSMRVCSVNFV